MWHIRLPTSELFFQRVAFIAGRRPSALPSRGPNGPARRCCPRPRAKITLDPNRPTTQVSNIAQSILSELDRAHGTRMKLTFDIDAETMQGFPEDVESIVRDNAASLRITDFGFEGE